MRARGLFDRNQSRASRLGDGRGALVAVLGRQRVIEQCEQFGRGLRDARDDEDARRVVEGLRGRRV
jgi:hypothetical protein